jgi:hypothetical protein
LLFKQNKIPKHPTKALADEELLEHLAKLSNSHLCRQIAIDRARI